MKPRAVLALMIWFVASCDPARVHEEQLSLQDRIWIHQHPLYFSLDVQNPGQSYNLKVSIRNSEDYPYSRLFLTWRLTDSLGLELSAHMESINLFDPKSGRPFGKSAIGDIFSHEFTIQEGYKFPHRGKYILSLQHSMREDSLKGIVSAGLRLERQPDQKSP